MLSKVGILATIVVVIFASVVWGQTPIGPNSKPCDAQGEPTGMETVVYEKGSGWEGYIVLMDDRGYVVTSSGYYRIIVGGNPLFQWRYITCKDFQVFETRGKEWRMGFVFFTPRPPYSGSQPVVEFYTNRIQCTSLGNSCTRK